MSEWKRVTDELPSLGLVVLGFYSDDSVDVVSCDAIDRDGNGHWSDKKAVIEPPLFWMPIPDFPD